MALAGTGALWKEILWAAKEGSNNKSDRESKKAVFIELGLRLQRPAAYSYII